VLERNASVFVTGATGGIGAVLVDQLRVRGARVYAAGRDPDRLTRLGVTPVVADLSRPARLAEAVGESLVGLTRLDALVHVAGVIGLSSVAETTIEEWDRHLAVNLTAAAELTRILLPALRAGSGRVVFVNSTAGRAADPKRAAYAASKFGLRALADSLRAEEIGRGVRVTTLYPGRVATQMQQQVCEEEGTVYDPDRFLSPQTVAETIMMVLDAPATAQLTELELRPDVAPNAHRILDTGYSSAILPVPRVSSGHRH
jgi:NADP-dependent 3-hydroxy acid dehydrogenase YdfG